MMFKIETVSGVNKHMLTRSLPVCAWLLWSSVAHATQTCQPGDIPATTPTSQFTDNHDGTATDTKTGLMWKRCSEGQTWNSANATCDGSTAYHVWAGALNKAKAANETGFAGHNDWRVPNYTELQSIVERQCVSPAINLNIFPNTYTGMPFWSSSPYPSYSSWAWFVSFGYGTGGGHPKNGFIAQPPPKPPMLVPFQLRLVRG